MKIKSFYAETMDQALQAASKEFGEEALILNTRETPAEFRHFGRYEVVCATTNPAERPVPSPLPSSRAAAQTGPREFLAFVGPSGSGKTTSCAKIAVRSKFTNGRNPAVLTWDSAQVGGAGFLRAYCELSDIPFQEIECESDLEAALTDFRSHDLILIDTPALAPASPQALAMAKAHRTLPSLKTHLVVSGTYATTFLAASFTAASIFHPGYLLPTHLDESPLDLRATGLDALRELRIEWCGTGRAVPEDLHASEQVVARAAEIAPVDFVPPQPIPAPPASHNAVEQILARFRREVISPETHHIRTSRQSAA
ncbi:hypothetical protein [Bryobacter aggregatus]|uniref:flagellar biosynthesis protein FlhF n=1 Tax=Bryobacter aggregatus TaxID=360054 RepID=UPI0004E229DF|nr:hypothetical protein [Bryobacter aggregatus]